MGWEAGRRNKTSTPYGIFIVIRSLEGLPTNAREAPSLHEVRLTPLDTNPVLLRLGDIYEKGVLKNIVKLAEKHLCLIFFNKISCWKPTTSST